MPNERYVKLSMKDRWALLPYDAQGDPAFKTLDEVRRIFSDDEVVVLVNDSLYSKKYQRETHANRRRK